ncbi:hypothetical protein PASE110613_09015 [Paenibacillus sediminis]|uniref:Uncharacterized protein n=1 Tax=Paenibacillus sediminis TaxID=664909 RepID=A0ABS4H6Q8_9BACL|nr:hypothetical protein [Paenibacillus sediminis]MBP1938214.1 hypothetical protein [Paenibacillus sediminis]
MNNFVRKAVSFNVDNAHQRELYEWVTLQSVGNFSGYVKTVLYAAMTAKISGAPMATHVIASGDDDSDAMNDIL